MFVTMKNGGYKEYEPFYVHIFDFHCLLSNDKTDTFNIGVPVKGNNREEQGV
jgi:hypothetical protein